MTAYEYTVIPAPNRGEKAKGARTGIERFAHTLTAAMNSMAADGWEYVRAETLPCEERAGLTGRNTVYHNVLVFRRALARPAVAAHPTPVATQHADRVVVAPAAPPDLQHEPVMQASDDARAEPNDPPHSWPDGPSPTAQAHRPHVPERVPADADSDIDDARLDHDSAQDPLIPDADTSGRPHFGQPMPKADAPKLGPAKR